MDKWREAARDINPDDGIAEVLAKVLERWEAENREFLVQEEIFMDSQTSEILRLSRDTSALKLIVKLKNAAEKKERAAVSIRDERFEALLESIRRNLESHTSLSDISAYRLVGLILSCLKVGERRDRRSLKDFREYESYFAGASRGFVYVLSDNTTRLLTGILERLNDDEIGRIAREARPPTLSALAFCIPSLCHDHRTRELAVPIGKKFFSYLRKPTFSKELVQYCLDRPFDFYTLKMIASAAKDDMPFYFKQLQNGKDPSMARLTGYRLPRENFHFANVIAKNLGRITNVDKRAGFPSPFWLEFFAHHMFTAPKLQRIYQAHHHGRIGRRFDSMYGPNYAVTLGTYGWPESAAFFRGYLSEENRGGQLNQLFGLAVRGHSRNPMGSFFPFLNFNVRGLSHMKLMWAMTVLGVVDDEELREAVDFLWSSYLDHIEETKNLNFSGDKDQELQAALVHYTEMFETIYAIEGRNERILGTLPTRPHPDDVVIKSQFEEGGETDSEFSTTTTTTNTTPIISGLLSLKASPEYDKYMREGGVDKHEFSLVERFANDISKTLDSLGFEHRRDFNPRLDMRGSRGVVVEEIVNWGGLEIVHESSKKVAIRVVPLTNSIKDVLAGHWVSDGFFKAQNRILESEGFTVVEIFHSEWNQIYIKEDVDEANKLKNHFVTKRLREHAGIELDWIGGRFFRKWFN
ncbi:hypothetical protein TrRE_jg1677 [Triparma retinervis]|uniref:Uncharacterized protein n=1 Tax=Triparma retinervis TaxID=2557542 RepID=A0A9W7E7I1_9STRA|nr:hypothetical protein TrRE_jg1677 [Triparma retinervis]